MSTAGSGSWVGCVSGAWVSGVVRGLFCLVVPRFRVGERETRTRRPVRARAPGKTAGQASSRALGVSSGSVFGPEEGVGAVRGCETWHGHRPPGAAAGTTAPDRESGDADQGSDGHVVDGQQRMRSTKQDPAPEGTCNDEAVAAVTTRPRRTGPGPTTAPAQQHDAKRPTAPDHESEEADQGSNGHVVDGQQRMRSTKQRPRPRRGRATTRRRPPPRASPAERTQGHHATSSTARRQADNRPRPRARGSQRGQQRPRSGRATTDAEHQAKTPAPEGTCNDEAVATVTSRPAERTQGHPHTSPTPRRQADNRPHREPAKPTRRRLLGCPAIGSSCATP
ncbi:hypothetical protein ABIA38_008614 [Embleya sp. AB8]